MTPPKGEGMDLIRQTFWRNIARAESFVAMYDSKIEGDSKKRSVAETDLLRAAVMFIHSSLEEFFRSLEIEYWREFDISYLNSIPFYWRAKPDVKLGLGDLFHEAEGKSIDKIVGESIEKNVYRTKNITKFDHIVDGLKKMNLDVNDFDVDRAKVSQLLTRRHAIVHQADRRERDEGKHKKGAVRSIRPEEVNEWLEEVKSLISQIIVKLEKRDNSGE